MRDESWVEGMRELAATFPDRDLPEAVLATRGDVYRRELGGLSDEAWLFAVRESIRNERWFPTVATLLEYAEGAGSPQPVAGLLPPHRPTEEEREARRREAAAQLDKIKAIPLPPTERPRAAYRDPAAPLVITDEKLDRARAQARQILAEEPAQVGPAGGQEGTR